MRERRETLALLAVVIFPVLAAIGLFWAYLNFNQAYRGIDQFAAPWAAARFWLQEGIQPYDERVTARIAAQTGEPDHPGFLYPLPSMIVFGWFGVVDYPAGRAAWMLVQQLALIGSLAAGVRLSKIAVPVGVLAALAACASFSPAGVWTILTGQGTPLVGLLIGVGLLAVNARQDVLAGFWLALAMIKPQLAAPVVIFAVLWSLSARRYQIAFTIASTLAVWYTVFLILLPEWAWAYLVQIIPWARDTTLASALSMLGMAAPGIQRPVELFLNGLAAGYLLVEWYLARGKDERWFQWTALLSLTITTLATVPVNLGNNIVLVIVTAATLKVWSDRWGGAGRHAVWILLALLAGLEWLFFRAAGPGVLVSAPLHLLTPLVCLLLLWWVRWWATHPPRVLLDELPRRIG